MSEAGGARGGSAPCLALAAARALLPDGRIAAATVRVDRQTGRITGVDAVPAGGARPAGTGDSAPSVHGGRHVDLGQRLLVPGFVDVHVHGAAGAEVNGGSAEEVARSVAEVAAFHARHGTTAIVATTVTDTPERLAATIAGVALAVRSARAGAARVLGSHLEGPFIAPDRAGAQDPAHIRPPDRAELNRLLELGEGTVRLVTLAPELPGIEPLIADCLAAGAAVALGHSGASYDTACRAFDAGASHVTHLWNAMAPLHHRRPGLVGAALSHGEATVEVVCDLHHVHPAVVALVLKAVPDRTVLVTDAMAATGAGPGRYGLGAMSVEVDGGRATLVSQPTTLAGSVLTMDGAVRNATGPVGHPLPATLAAASSVPASVVAREADGRGHVAAGAPADLVVLEPTLTVAATLVGGVPVYDPGGLLG